jgi:hypothetical protein
MLSYDGDCFILIRINMPAIVLCADHVSQLELYRASNFTGSMQFYTWDQLDRELCATFS